MPVPVPVPVRRVAGGVAAGVLGVGLGVAYAGPFVVSGLANHLWWLLSPLVLVPAAMVLVVAAWRERARGRAAGSPPGGWYRLLWLPTVLFLPLPVFMSAITAQAELRPPCAFPAPDGNPASCGDPLTVAGQAAWGVWWSAGGATLVAALVCILWTRRSGCSPPGVARC
ncbi:MAG: hypothetical protein GEV11_01470 [Streptosporangiales bacterium]|nr:hypothetical protein [Streptosporangiales bacterium]